MLNQQKSLWSGLSAKAKTIVPGRHSNLKFQTLYFGQSPDPITPFLTPVTNLVAQSKFEEAVERIKRYESSKFRTRDGETLQSRAVRLLTYDFGDDGDSITHNESLLGRYEDWYNRRPDCPFAAATYANTLTITAHSHRGTDWAHKVSDQQWDMMKKYSDQANEVMTKTQMEFSNHWYWSLAYLGLALQSNEVQAVHMQRFQICVNANRWDVTPYRKMGQHMLPRWFGSFETLDQLAQWAAKVTESRLGMMMYAVIYDDLKDYHDLSEMGLDWEKMKQGYKDWMTRLPHDCVATSFAASAFMMEDYDCCLDVLEGLNHFFEACWDSPTNVHLANSLCREYTGR